MKKENLPVRLEISKPNGDKKLCTLIYSYQNKIDMSIFGEEIEAINVSADDIFEALSLIRLELEKSNYLILCNGARTDAYPSRMSRQMGIGGRLYIFKMGIPSMREDLVDALEPAELQKVGTVAAQRMAYESWLKSLNA